MLFPRAEPTGTRPITLIQTLLPTSAQGDLHEEIIHRLAQISLGQQLDAEIQSKLSDGGFLVKIGDVTARMNLPGSMNVGDRISLTFIGKEPRPTFLLNTQTDLPDSTSSTTSLSSTGKLIDSMLHNLRGSKQSASLGKIPIASQPDFPAPQMALALQDTLGKTGVFYESHLNEWVNGQRTLADIRQEPQAQQINQMNALLDAKTAFAPLDSTNSTLTQLVNQQLQTLEQNRIVWQGEVWPGQSMHWEVSEDTASKDIATLPSWRSEVRFEMPQLGSISATLVLTGERLALQIHANTASAGAQLQAESNQLSEALAAAGIPLEGLRVSFDE